MSVNTRKGPIFDPGLCRCCGAIKKCRLLNFEYEWSGKKEIYSDMFMDCFGLLLSYLDGGAQERLICATCVSRLREAACFRHQVLQCEEKLLRTKIHGEGNELKLEASVKEDTFNVNVEPTCLDYNDGSDNIDNGILSEDASANKEVKKTKRKSSKQKSKNSKKRKSRKTNEKVSDDTIDMTYHMQNNKQLEMQDLKLQEPTQKQNGYKTDNSKLHYNITTIVENSFACPFDTSFSDYFCVYCRQLFTDPNKLREHSMTHDPTGFKDVLMNNPNNKKLQIDIHRIDCRLCSEPINDLAHFKQHITTSHGKVLHEDAHDYLIYKLTSGTLSCTECKSTFGFFHALKKHMAEHFGTCICDVCGAHYFEERMLVLHQKTHQRVEETFTCQECGKCFKSKYTRYIHVARTHKKEAAYQCNKCDEVFFSYTLRYRHMREVHGEERTFQCEQCDRAYDSRKSLREHNRRHHLKILKHQCDVCDKRFYLPSRLKEHMASHTGERNFRCEYCGKSYPRLRGLKVHMQSHTTEKKFKCVMCNASFTQNVNLKNHIKRQHQSMDLDENFHE